jgi:hypothetical protein
VSSDVWEALCRLWPLKINGSLKHVPILECFPNSRLTLVVKSVNYFRDYRKLRLKKLFNYLLKLKPCQWNAHYGNGLTFHAEDLVRCNSQGVNRKRTVQSEKLDKTTQLMEQWTARHICSVCQQQSVEKVFTPCGHAACCAVCTKCILSDEDVNGESKCPVCRASIRHAYNIYLAT